MAIGQLAIVLHAHLPFIRHPEYPEFLEEDWLFEAVSETYIPLLFSFRDLAEQGVRFRVTMTLTPPLCEMLSDPMLQDRYLRHVERLIELSEKEILRCRQQPEFLPAAEMYLEHFRASRMLFEDWYHRDLLRAFRELQQAGQLEIITSGATHGFLPLMSTTEGQRAQIEIARGNYWKHFHRAPVGIWLPECGYAAGIDTVLRDAGLNYFFVDSHGLLYGSPPPVRNIYAPVRTPSGVHAFARDVQTSEQVWSADTGYPGDPDYREFYRDLGYDAPYDYISPYLHSDGIRRNIGLKYFRVTGKVGLDQKQPYHPEWARDKAAAHAEHFLQSRQSQVRALLHRLDRKPIIVSPYDAELFGHWWYEGPLFLKALLRKIHHDQDEVETAAPTDYLREYPDHQEQAPAASSWGAEGYYRVWINGSNEWMYKHLHVAEQRMVQMANRFRVADGLVLRALNQAARELLLAQSSDWAFIVTTGTAVQYAVKRFKDHIHRFTRLYEDLERGAVDEAWLRDVENRDTIFQEIDYRVYQSE